MIISKNPRSTQKRTFLCLICGAEAPATKRKGRTHPGHIKTMWCYRCKDEREFIQQGVSEVRTTEERIERLEELVDSMGDRKEKELPPLRVKLKSGMAGKP